jgi:DNA-binding MarR family transcriptional regulator
VDHGLAIAAVRATARVSRLLERASSDLTLSHYRILAAVASGEERASRVAHRLALGKPTVSAVVDQLVQRGLMARGSVAADQRAAALSVTSAGRDLLEVVEAEMVGRLEAVCAQTPDPRQTLVALAWLGDALDSLAGPTAPTAAAAESMARVAE